jgi:hypothetical protein
MFSVTRRPLYPRENTSRPQFLLARRLDEPQSPSEVNGEEENLLFLPGIECRFFGYPGLSLFTVLTEVYRLVMYKGRFWD